MSVALVTGSFRRMGAGIALRLAERGHDIALHGSPGSVPEDGLLDRLRGHGARVETFHADLADEADISTLVAAAAAAFGEPPAVLVNNAALFEDDAIDTVGMACLLSHYKVNAAAPVLLARAFAAALGTEGRGVVVNLLDQRIASPHGDQLSYTISKQAAAAATRTLAEALAPRIRVCGVAPGLTIPTADYDAGQLDRLAEMMPLGRLVRPDEVADAVAYLVGAEAVTGQIIFVDGGAWLRSFARDFVHLGRE